ncbi:hypothetical protein RI367_002068 [Sorochytrium milnesiophthora]
MVPATTTNLAIRLLDGTVLRHSFDVTSTLAGVRSWITSQSAQAAATPFVLLTAFPAQRTFTTGEEESGTLARLGLVPSATLILRAASGQVADAYDGAAGTSMTPDVVNATAVSPISALFGAVGWAVGAVSSVFQTTTTTTTEPTAVQEAEEGDDGVEVPARHSTVDTGVRSRKPQSTYNGNTTMQLQNDDDSM